MKKKVGRNDPCPCGSGKKYKNCCMKEQQVAAKYTSSGKRKFKATVLTAEDKSLSVFGRSASVQQAPVHSETLEKMKFHMTQSDFRKKETQKPIKFMVSEEKLEERERHLPKPDELFKPTEENFHKEK